MCVYVRVNCVIFGDTYLIQPLLFTVTPGESSKTWGRSSVVPKEEGEEEEKRAPKKKGRTWGPGTLGQKELTSGDEG